MGLHWCTCCRIWLVCADYGFMYRIYRICSGLTWF